MFGGEVGAILQPYGPDVAFFERHFVVGAVAFQIWNTPLMFIFFMSVLARPYLASKSSGKMASSNVLEHSRIGQRRTDRHNSVGRRRGRRAEQRKIEQRICIAETQTRDVLSRDN